MSASESMVDVTYGKALFKAAQDIQKEEEILEEILVIDDLFREKREYFSFLVNPSVEKTLKKQLLRELLEGKITKELLNFMLILIDKRRLSAFAGITHQYHKSVSESKNMAQGVLVSAVPLDEAQMLEMQEKVAVLMRKKIIFVNKVDKTIIGGVKIFVEDKIIDATIQTRLKSMRSSLDTVFL